MACCTERAGDPTRGAIFMAAPPLHPSRVFASFIYIHFSCLPPSKYLLATYCYLFVGYLLLFSPWMFDILEREWFFAAMRPARGLSKTNCSRTPKWQSMITHCKESKWLPMEWLGGLESNGNALVKNRCLALCNYSIRGLCVNLPTLASHFHGSGQSVQGAAGG